jgi:hypothetical protein
MAAMALGLLIPLARAGAYTSVSYSGSVTSFTYTSVAPNGQSTSVVLTPGTTVSLQGQTFYYDMAGWSATVAVPAFNPTLGTLEGITFDLTGFVGDDVTATNKSGKAGIVTATLSATLNLTMPNGTTIVSAPSASESKSVAASGAGATVTWTPGDSSLESLLESSSTLDASSFAAFIGTGSVNLPIMSASTSKVVGPGNMSSRVSTNAGANWTITYDYQTWSTPELGPFGLMGLSMLPVAGVALRRRKRR